MSEELNQNLSSNEQVVEAPVETPSAPAIETPVEPVNQTAEILAGLEKQFSSITEDAPAEQIKPTEDGAPTTEEPVEEPAEEPLDEEISDEYDAEELYTSTKAVTDNPKISQLEAELAQMKAQMAAYQQQASQGQPTQKPLEVLPLVTEEEFEKAMQNPEEFNRLLNKTMYTGYEMAQRQSQVAAIQVVERVLQVQNTVNSFFGSNPDLKPHEKLMGLVWRDIAASKPSAKLEDVIVAAGEETRRILKLKGVKTGKLKPAPDAKPARPAFARPSGGGARSAGMKGNGRPGAAFNEDW